MSKDKEWLEKELVSDLMKFSGNGFLSEFDRGHIHGLNAAQSLAYQLDEPKITEEQARNEEIARLSDYLLRNFEKEIGGDRNYETPVDAAIRLLGEKRKPVIPQFVADWIEKWKYEGLAMREWFTFYYDNEEDDEVAKWLYDNDCEENTRREYLLIDAIRYGYEVEKEPQWVVLRNCMYIKNFYFGEMNDDYRVGSIADKEQAMVFTDKAKAEAVALLVDGEVKEVTE